MPSTIAAGGIRAVFAVLVMSSEEKEKCVVRLLDTLTA